jgi:hypothetical protein
MALPTGADLGTLDWTSQGVPFNNTTSKDTIDTMSLDFVFNGVPFIAAVGGTPLPPVVSNTSQFFIVF